MLRKEIRFDNYPGMYNHTETYFYTDYHCPKCGEKEVWVESGLGDYYEGPTYLCTKCETSFKLPTIRKADEELWEDHIIKKLKE